MKPETIKRFMTFVHKDKETGQGVSNRKGYGVFCADGAKVFAHRFAYKFLADQPLSAHEAVLHSCDNPSCVSPAHLRAGDARGNSDDRWLRYQREVTDVQRILIHSYWRIGKSPDFIRRLFNLTEETVRSIVESEADPWADLQGERLAEKGPTREWFWSSWHYTDAISDIRVVDEDWFSMGVEAVE